MEEDGISACRPADTAADHERAGRGPQLMRVGKTHIKHEWIDDVLSGLLANETVLQTNTPKRDAV